MQKIQIFSNSEFGDIRTVMIDGEPWFTGKDLSASLGYKNNTSAMRNVDSDDKRVCPVSTPSGTQKMTVVNESGMYALIFGSKLESAKKFKIWVTKEVLPSIRKTGSYGQAQLPENPMKLLEIHYQALKQVDNKVDDVSAEVQTVKKELKEFKETLPLLPEDADEISDLVKKRGVEILGGKQSSAYNDRGLRMKLYVNFYSNLKYNFKVRTYKAIKRNQKAQAIEIIQRYEPPFFLAEQIEQANAQQSLNLKGGANNEK